LAEQLVSLVHCTHSPVDVLHAGAPPPHCAALVQPWMHWLDAGSQTIPASPQFAVVKHWTHWLRGEQ
jgi:hypothetical protein